MSENNKSRFSREDSNNGKTRRISVKEVENGYVIDISYSWEDEKKGYQYEEKTYISKDNPLSKDEEDELLNAVSSMLTSKNAIEL